MSKRAKPASYEDIVALPEHLVGEIVGGELIVSPHPEIRQIRATSALGVLVGGPFDVLRSGPGGWWIFKWPELRVGEDVLVPDLAGWRRERVPVARDGVFTTLAPDWVCEVLSPSTGRVDRELKLPLYAHEGVGHVWLIDPKARRLDALRLGQGNWHPLGTYGGDQRARVEPFDAIELDLAPLWLPEPPDGANADTASYTGDTSLLR